MFILLLLISSQGIQALDRGKGGCLEIIPERPLSFLIWEVDSAWPDGLTDPSLY
jgi:hypothetical protein